MTEKIEAVLEAKSFDGFDQGGQRCKFKSHDIVYLSRTQCEAFKDQFSLTGEERDAEEPPPPPPPPEDPPPPEEPNPDPNPEHGRDDDDDDEDEEDD